MNTKFLKGVGQLRLMEVDDFKEKFKKLFGISSDTSYYRRLNGEVSLNKAEQEALEGLFKEFNITEIWGE